MKQIIDSYHISIQKLRYVLILVLVVLSSKMNAYDFEVDGLCYNIISSDQVEVTYRVQFKSNYSGSLQLPEKVIYNDIVYSVTKIGVDAFSYCSGLTGSLSIPNSVTSIGEGAFHQCSGLTGALIIPQGVIYIGNYAFSACTGLTSISIPNSVKTIGRGAFGSCKGLTSITIPSSVTSFGIENFTNCYNLSSIVVENGNTEYDSRNNCNAIIHTSSNELLVGCQNTIIPNSVTSIGYCAFAGCIGLSSVSIPGFVTRIDEGAFNSCSSLTEVYCYATNVPSTHANAFARTNIEYADLYVPVSSINSYKSEAPWNAFKSITSIEGYSYYSLSITVTGNGSASYDGENIRETTKTYSVNDGTPATISLTPDDGYRIKSVKSNNKDVTSSVSNNQYTVTVNSDTSVEVEFEAIPVTTYTLSITATGNGNASYDGNTIKSKTSTFTVNEGTKATISFTPDDGYRIKSLKVNGSEVTASMSYTATVNSNTTVEVEFEAIPITPSNCSISITASGNGSVSYGGDNIRGATKTYTVTEGTTATFTITPDNGYRIKSLKVNGSSVSVTNSYSITINSDTTIEVEFEEIPDTPSVTTYTLSITASGNGSANYGGESIRGTSRSYSLNEGSSVSISFTPDEGYRIESVKVNGSNIGKETGYSTTLNANTTIEVVFEAIPVTTYSLTVTASGNGVATFDGTDVRNGSQFFTVNEGSDAIVAFTPDKGYKVEVVKVDGNEVEVAELYTISDITSDKTIEVAFAEMDRNFSIDGVSYLIESFEDNTVTLTGVQNTITLEVSVKVNYQAQEWSVIGISENALDNSEELAAIIWDIQIPFTAKVANPNLLLYVKDESYAPAGIRNVVVNGFAKTITLTDAQSGNNFYCPETFTTQSIIYTHNYSMKTGLNESKGWETITLPFDVQQISHNSKGEIIPFAKWSSNDNLKPFWLYELSGSGFVEAENIKANTPYIISMPNNEIYPSDYQLAGRVTFSALNAEVKKSDDVQSASFSNRLFMPNFICQEADAGMYALNVRNDYEAYSGGENEGSKFILNLRKIHPFEAYMTSTSNARAFDIFDDMKTAIRGIEDIAISKKQVKVYDLSGKLLKVGASLDAIKQELPAGVYIVNNQKIMVK